MGYRLQFVAVLGALAFSAATAKRKKMVDLPEGVKRRVVAQFLAVERAEPDEIKRRLRQVFGESASSTDLLDVAGPEARRTWTLDRRLRDRVVIQFLTAEHIGAKEIFSRLREAYGECLPPSSVQRWAQQFRNEQEAISAIVMDAEPTKHADWRKVAKKTRRKRIRSALAAAREKRLAEEQAERSRSPRYQAWAHEQEVLEAWREEEEERQRMQRQQAFATAEESALLKWREQQSRLQQAKAEKFKRECMIKEEWEREQRKLQIAEEVRKKNEDEKKRKQAELMAQIDAFIEGKADFPEEVNVSTQTQPGLPDCPFFSKTGACRFRDSCSRNHIRPGLSRTLLIPNFYDHIGLSALNQAEYDTDIALEYEDSETYQHFKEFYGDVLPEFEECGRVTQFVVCTNEEPHLRGNVYVEFQSRRQSLKAYRTFQGRFYAGRRLNVEFTAVPSWKNAVCGLYHRQKCPKGKTCNFLHVFRNPENAFKISDRTSSRRLADPDRSRSRTPLRKQERTKEWNWSDGSGSETETKRKRSRSRSKGRSKGESSRGRRKKRSRERRKVKKRSRSKSKDRDRKRSKSRERKKSKSKDRKRSRSRSKDRKRHKDESKKKDKKEKSKDSRSRKDSNGEETSKRNKDKEDKNKSNNSDKSSKEKKEEGTGKSDKKDDSKSRKKDREGDKRKKDGGDHIHKKHREDSTKTSVKSTDSTKTNSKEKKDKEEEKGMRNKSVGDSDRAKDKAEKNSLINGDDFIL